MTSSSSVEYPEFPAQGTSHEIFLDAGLQLTNLLLDSKKGLPLGDEFNRELVADGFDWLSQLSVRIRMEPKGRHTEQISQLHRDRCAYFRYIGRGAVFVLEDPDRSLSEDTREAARMIDELVSKRKVALSSKSRPSTSTALRFFLEDCEPKPVLAALEAIGLRRHFLLLEKANAAYQDLLLKASRREGDEFDGETPSESEARIPAAPALPTLRKLRQEAAYALDQTFANMKQHAKKGRDPYRQLLGACAQITTKLASLSKTQETRTRKAKAKDAASGSPTAPRSSAKPAPGAAAAQPANAGKAGTEKSGLPS